MFVAGLKSAAGLENAFQIWCVPRKENSRIEPKSAMKIRSLLSKMNNGKHLLFPLWATENDFNNTVGKRDVSMPIIL